MKNMRISKKLTLGFGCVVLWVTIMIIVTIVFNLNSYNKILAIDIDSTLQNYLSTAIYNFSSARVDAKSIAFAQDDQLFSNFTSKMATVQTNLADMLDHSDKNKILQKFSSSIKTFKNTTEEYANSINAINSTSLARNNTGDYIESELIPALLDSCGASFANQMTILERESGEDVSVADKLRRVVRIEEANDIIVNCNLVISNTIQMIEHSEHIADLYDSTMTVIDETLDYLITFRDSAKNQSTYDGAQVTIEALNPYREALVNFREQNDLYIEANQSALTYGPQALQEMDALTAAIDSAMNTQIENTIAETGVFLIVSIVLAVLAIGTGLGMAVTITKSVVEALRNSVNNMSQVSGTVLTSSNQLSGGSQMLAENSSEQAAGIQETSATMNETASMVRHNKESTREAANLSTSSERAVLDSVEKVKLLVGVMNNLSESSLKIGNIVETINSIASQTNILALNASVEAARVGEAGQGFAVVAEEVRTLAQKSAEAVSSTASIVDENISLSAQGAESTEAVRDALNTVLRDVQKVTGLLSEISDASEEQSKGIDQINVALSQLEKATQSNAAVAEETSASADGLVNSSSALSDVTEKLAAMI